MAGFFEREVMEQEDSVPCPSLNKESTRNRKRNKTTGTPHHTEREKDIFLWLANLKDPNTGRKLLTHEQIAAAPHAPKPRTLARWLKEKKEQPALKKPKLKTGPKPKLNEIEKRIIGGWVIECGARGEAVTIEKIRAFIAFAFRVDYRKTWISNTMHELGFSSRRTQESSFPRNDASIFKQMTSFLITCQDTIKKGFTPPRIVAMDVKTFWTEGPVLRSYAIRGV